MPINRVYRPGRFWRICDRSGLRIWDADSKKEWTGLMIRNKSWEERHPQDFVRGVADPQNVPEVRPVQTTTFIGPLGTVTTASVAAGISVIPVQQSARMLPGDIITIMLDNGENKRFTITNVTSAIQITVTPKLPFSSASGNEVIDYSAYSAPDIG